MGDGLSFFNRSTPQQARGLRGECSDEKSPIDQHISFARGLRGRLRLRPCGRGGGIRVLFRATLDRRSHRNRLHHFETRGRLPTSKNIRRAPETSSLDGRIQTALTEGGALGQV